MLVNSAGSDDVIFPFSFLKSRAFPPVRIFRIAKPDLLMTRLVDGTGGAFTTSILPVITSGVDVRLDEHSLQACHCIYVIFIVINISKIKLTNSGRK